MLIMLAIVVFYLIMGCVMDSLVITSYSIHYTKLYERPWAN